MVRPARTRDGAPARASERANLVTMPSSAAAGGCLSAGGRAIASADGPKVRAADLYLRGRGRTARLDPPGGFVSMIRVLARIGAPVLVVLAIAGCGSSNSSSSSTAATSTTSTAAGGTVAAVASQVPAKYKSKGTLIVASEAEYAPNEFLAPNGHTIIGHGSGPRESAGRSDGPANEVHQRPVRSDHPRHPGRALRPRRVVVHRHQGTREEGRLRHLLQGRDLLLREGERQPGGRKPQGPVRQDRRGREGHRRAGRSRKTEHGVHERRQEGRDRPELPRPERREPGDRQRAR